MEEMEGAMAVAEAPEETAQKVDTRQKAKEPETEAQAIESEAEPVSEENGDIAYDVDLDYNMEWEVETEPAEGRRLGGTDQYFEGREDHDSFDESNVYAARRINKHIFTWICSYCFGIFGVDRFMRGQIGMGVLKMLTFGGIGCWYLADCVIAAVKSYGGGYRGMEDLLFDEQGRYIY